ncbi:uncharacterized protein UMAG_01299 [Mycosarcoma maydis]|uniref:Uncharacterized protein n=1 Tax=Mycosarcoma maydis TaxID=5270 RepID=A0A0D1EAI7_MYCMD|nr:uncharacterized protein UMAG_01299 [Ustilago maydis 521]KIS71400.1 hypothetical protein UMAG_01299 [Ustilago maydis 521]|eukprot:XP_011387213.1 hypothetical protein UMAG_01299 [Ustilago maydis 521]
MLSQNLLASFLGLLVTTKVVTAALDSGIFDKSAYGQAEWSRYCSSSVSKSADLLAHACFTIHDDITSAVHSSSEDHLGYASASGQDFVVTAPEARQNSKVEFFASGFWFSVRFSAFLKCANVSVRAPIRVSRGRTKEGQEPALAPFMEGTYCAGSERKIFTL